MLSFVLVPRLAAGFSRKREELLFTHKFGEVKPWAEAINVNIARIRFVMILFCSGFYEKREMADKAAVFASQTHSSAILPLNSVMISLR
jgi:hypothetical protein